MKGIKNYIIILMLIALTISVKAQYLKVTRGDTCKFDTAVLTEIATFRQETVKLRLCDSVIIYADSTITKKDTLASYYRELDKTNKRLIRLNEKQCRADKRKWCTVSFFAGISLVLIIFALK